MPISKGKFSKDLFDGFQMHQYAMRCLDEAIAAAPQPEPNHNWCVGCSPDNCSGCGAEPGAHTPHQPDRTAELEAEITKLKLDLLTSYGEAEELSGKVAELEDQIAVLQEQIDLQIPAGVMIAQMKRIAELEAALKVANDALNDCEGALDECRDYPITYDAILEALAKINEVLK